MSFFEWNKNIFEQFNIFCCPNRKQRRKSAEKKNTTFYPLVDQRLGVNQHLGVAPKHWQTLVDPFYSIFQQLLTHHLTPEEVNIKVGVQVLFYFNVFTIFTFLTGKDVKKLKKMILTSIWHSKHPFNGQNTQHLKLFLLNSWN